MYYVIGKPLKLSVNQPRFQYYREEKERMLREKREKVQKKRQNFVHNPGDEISCEPYMIDLQKEYSEASIECDSNFELPWGDIALPHKKLEIRQEVDIQNGQNNETVIGTDDKNKEQKKPSDKIELPWSDIIIDDMVVKFQRQQRQNLKTCDSSLEIPWEDFTLETPTRIKDVPQAETCDREDIEIPWDNIILPKDIIIEPKIRKHPTANTRRLRNNLDCKNSSCCDRCTKEKRKQYYPVDNYKPV
ncbi:uncharacterized protein [Chelonus insularis]|uniref:uncharacterized protein isoform X2 n=1 Tax=Chelonus insularis TaxID=460826 RepID=UPI00158A8A3F|nr:uncharacterized protein LOC118073832 isoform X2 [Chelonus insularis]